MALFSAQLAAIDIRGGSYALHQRSPATNRRNRRDSPLPTRPTKNRKPRRTGRTHPTGQGFVFNNRDDRKMLHQVNCESLEVMSTTMYEKLFFDDLDIARNWLDWKYGADGWLV